ncbi:MAG: hypothetical protein LC623_03810 [Halobacteriales archaeon]|nr:hypothetical protein [Halobacteriales archaeon]
MKSSWLLLLVLAAPLAQGAMTLTATPPDHPLAPDLEVGDLTVVVAVDCTDLATRPPDLTRPGDVTLAVSADRPGTQISGPLKVPVPLEPCAQPGATQATGTVKLQVSFTREAPGETDIKATVTGTLPKAGQPKLEASASAILQAAYTSLLVVSVRDTILTTHGKEAVAHVEVHNAGNAPTTVEFTLASEPSGSVDALLPGMLLLAPQANATADLVLRGHGSWRQDTVRVVLTRSSAKHPAMKGDPVAVNFLVRNGDLVLGVPSTGPVLALALVGCAAVASRRRA